MSVDDDKLDMQDIKDFLFPGSDSADMQAEIDALKADLEAATKEKLYALAELENFRNRSNRIAAEEKKYASIELMRELLPIWDNIHRALEAADKTHDVDSLISGIQIVADQFVNVFEKHGCKRILALHTPFDPNVHESIAMQPSDDFEPNTVLHETQAGFKLHDRVVRPSQVVLAISPPSK